MIPNPDQQPTIPLWPTTGDILASAARPHTTLRIAVRFPRSSSAVDSSFPRLPYDGCSASISERPTWPPRLSRTAAPLFGHRCVRR